MDSRGFPAPWSADEYSTYFERIFGRDLCHFSRGDQRFESAFLQRRVSNQLFLAVFTIATTLTPAFGFRRKARPHRGHRDYIPLRR